MNLHQLHLLIQFVLHLIIVLHKNYPIPCLIGYFAKYDYSNYNVGNSLNSESQWPSHSESPSISQPETQSLNLPTQQPSTIPGFVEFQLIFNFTVGATKLKEACQPCLAGYYCNEYGLTDITNYKCPKGVFCPEGNSSKNAIHCSASTWSNLSAAVSLANCKSCINGIYCPQASTQQYTCPAGFYCIEGQITAFDNPCPAGTYNPFTGRNII